MKAKFCVISRFLLSHGPLNRPSFQDRLSVTNSFAFPLSEIKGFPLDKKDSS